MYRYHALYDPLILPNKEEHFFARYTLMICRLHVYTNFPLSHKLPVILILDQILKMGTKSALADCPNSSNAELTEL